MPSPEIDSIITALRSHIVSQGLKPDTVKARLAELSFLTGYAAAKGGTHRLPPAVLLCGLSGRSVLTLSSAAGDEGKQESPAS